MMMPILSMMEILKMKVRNLHVAKDFNFEINIKIVKEVSYTASGECSRISTSSSL